MGCTTALRSCRCSSSDSTPNDTVPIRNVTYVRSKAEKLSEQARLATI